MPIYAAEHTQLAFRNKLPSSYLQSTLVPPSLHRHSQLFSLILFDVLEFVNYSAKRFHKTIGCLIKFTMPPTSSTSYPSYISSVSTLSSSVLSLNLRDDPIMSVLVSIQVSSFRKDYLDKPFKCPKQVQVRQFYVLFHLINDIAKREEGQASSASVPGGILRKPPAASDRDRDRARNSPPSTQQHQAQSPLISNDSDDDECSICLEQRKDVHLQCLHAFCYSCFKAWNEKV
jgi:hypothetical protein